MKTKIQKWGNSLGVRLPKEEIKKTNLREGKTVLVQAFQNSILIKSIPKGQAKLRDLVKKINSKNRHAETDWGNPVGNEIW